MAVTSGILAVFLVLVVGRESVLAGGSSPELHCGRRLVSGLFSRPRLPIGYSYVTTIPLGACRLNISAILPSENYIALKISNGSYIINGEFAVSPPGVYEAAGARFHYTRSDRIDSIFSVGPVYFPIDIMILSSQPNPTIRYEYFTESVPGEVEKETLRPNMIIPELQPSSLNNKPFRKMHRDYYDMYRRTTNIVTKHPSIQLETSRQPETPRNPEVPRFPEKISSSWESEIDEDDNIQENVIGGRRFIWKIMHYTQCSHTCGGGIQVGKYRCVELRANFEKEVSPAHCMGDPPSNKKRKCGTNPCQPRWRAALWSTCPECGPASRTRIVGCVQDHSKGISKVSDNKCPKPKPRTSEQCNIPDCAEVKGVMFVTSKRGIRPKGTGGLTETFRDGPVFSIATNHTNFDMGPEYSLSSPAVGWLTTNWSECVGWCVGGGVRSRNVHCTDPSGCAPRRPPEDYEKCQPQQICEAHDGEWFTGDWSPCTSQCEGKQVRGVICIGGTGRRLRDAACKAPRPEATRDCGDGCKPTWFSSEWGPCEENCTILTGVRRRTVWCATRDGATQDSLCADNVKPNSEQACKPKCEHAYSQHKPRAPQPPTAFKIPDENEYLPKEIREVSPHDGIEHVRRYETTTVGRNIQHNSHNDNVYDNTNTYNSNGNNANNFNNDFNSPNNNKPYDFNNNANNGYRPNVNDNGPNSSGNNVKVEHTRNIACMDKLNNCGLAVQARLCNYNYYKQMCCLSCGSSSNKSY